MSSADTEKFFKKKKDWSKYKDLILDYYLHPYIAKVSRLRKPVAIIDCFAGAGRFEDGELGSPLIIAKHLQVAQQRGTKVVGMFIESNKNNFKDLEHNLKGVDIPIETRCGDFRGFTSEILQLADTHTVFVYVDPIRPGDLRFNDLKAVYDKLKSGHSVETFINFLSFGFVRRTMGCLSRASRDGKIIHDHHEVVECNEIAGGTTWQKHICDDRLKHRERIDLIAHDYSNRLKEMFKYILSYPIRPKYDSCPKYHLIFGSRHPDAVELMNRAMVTARRKFISAQFVEEMLFANEPKEEVVKLTDVIKYLLETSHRIGRTTWKSLRVCATIDKPSMYLDTDWNKGIKQAIKQNRLGSTADGSKKEDYAEVWRL